MLTQAPLPAWLNLCRAMVRHAPPDAELAAPWHRYGEEAGWLSRSAWSLALIALWRKSRAPALQVTVWLPDYFCNSALVVLRKTGAKLVFYPLTAEMAPDITACRALLGAGPPDLFLLVHYFGQAAAFAPARDFCGHHGAWLIEDAAHVLRPVDGVGVCGDFVIYSPHKFLPIPDGAVLVVRPEGPARFGTAAFAPFGLPTTWPEQLRDLQTEIGGAVDSNRVRALVWLVKRVLQKFGVRSLRPTATAFAEPLELREAAAPQLTAPSQSALARRLLAVLLPDLGAVARWRQRHQLLWDNLLASDEAGREGRALAAKRPTNREWTPYLAGYRLDSGMAPAIYAQWQDQGLPATTWPDLPPEVMGNQASHDRAVQLRHTRLFLPLHQSLSSREMLKKGRLRDPVSGAESSLRVAWDAVSPAQWRQWMTQVGRSNLLQSHAYGEAKSADSSWRIKRGVFYRGAEPIALVQVLQKRLAGALRVSRINRGPVFLGSPSGKDQHAVMEVLAGLGCLWRGRVLAMAPELALSGSNLALMESLAFRQFSPAAWQSIWVDLRMDLARLRTNLDGKWRNMLTFSEKAGLSLDIGTDDPSFEWMMARYEELMRDKTFSGPPIELLRTLREHLPVGRRPIVMRAVYNGEMVAGICLVCHGAAATYLLGWNGKAGRSLKANQYLLWQAIVHLKQAGLDWFDLGGISEDNTPGISAFKSGLGGEQYELVGEYWKW